MSRLLLLLALAGCMAPDPGGPKPKPPTLLIDNPTIVQYAVLVDDVRIGTAFPGRATCLVLRGLSPGGDVVLGFRPLAGIVIYAMPVNALTNDGWAVTMRDGQSSGGFFAIPTPPCT